MVKVTYTKVPKKSGQMIDLYNPTLEMISKDLTQRWSKVTCEHHPHQTSTITISFNSQGKLTERRSFCCEDFSKLFKFEK